MNMAGVPCQKDRPLTIVAHFPLIDVEARRPDHVVHEDLGPAALLQCVLKFLQRDIALWSSLWSIPNDETVLSLWQRDAPNKISFLPEEGCLVNRQMAIHMDIGQREGLLEGPALKIQPEQMSDRVVGLPRRM
jgi:hypothetical protein